MHIIGTAGHVDHGKSSLVIALTGHNPDRFIEERERGMTLDLGFAPLRFGDGVEAGIIDVPGHERFLHNMLAGAAGMELLLLVVAANEGPRQQTLEHLHILNFLNVRKAIIVLTKRDLVDETELEIASELARDATKNTIVAGAPVIAVSSVTAAGMDELKAAIHSALLALPPRDARAPAYLPIDRVFALPGHGTVVTGTLMQGTIRTGDELALQPSGLLVRVRSLQTFGEKLDTVSGGARVAVNLPGIETSAIRRGEALVARREFVPSDEVRVTFTALPDAVRLLKRRTPVRAYIGAAEIPGTLAFDTAPPCDGEAVAATLRLSRPAVVFPGSRLVLRRMSPKDLLGGATARPSVGAGPAAVNDRSDGDPIDRGDGDPLDDRILALLRASGLQPLDLPRVAAAANVVITVASDALERLRDEGRVLALQRPVAYLARDAADAAFDRLSEFLRVQQERKPWGLGADLNAIAKALAIPEALAGQLLHAWHEDGRLARGSAAR
jgi:selenocysteine-specific elongation factor